MIPAPFQSAMKKWSLLALVALLFVGCSGDNPGGAQSTDAQGNNCEQEVLISSRKFNNAPDDELTIDEMEISGDCLNIRFNGSGCDGSSWELKLVDSGAIMESDPPQRDLRLSLKDREDCEALITQEISFGISALQVEGGEVILNIVNSGEEISYQY